MNDYLIPDVTYEDYLANARAQMAHDRAAFTGEAPLSPGAAEDRAFDGDAINAAFADLDPVEAWGTALTVEALSAAYRRLAWPKPWTAAV